MRATRTSTKKLPKRALVLQDEVVTTHKSLKKNNVSKNKRQKSSLLTPKAKISQQSSIIQTFSNKFELLGGLCILRSLGGNKYETINLSQIDHQTISSEDSGRIIKANKGSLEALTTLKEEWGILRYKVEQAINAANNNIFRLEKLPLELRYRIYRFSLIGDKSLKNYKRSVVPRAQSLALSLMETCKWIYHECRAIFYRNSLEINDVFRHFKPLLQTFKDNLRDVTFSWWAFSKKDPDTLRFFATCKNLRIFNLLVTKYTVSSFYPKPQKSFQSNTSIKKFNRCNGFDALLELRGLEKVTVRRDVSPNQPSGDLTDAELKTFENFLTTQLTQPRPQTLPQPTTVSAQRRRQDAQDYRFDISTANSPRLQPRFPRNASAIASRSISQQAQAARAYDSEDDEVEETGD